MPDTPERYADRDVPYVFILPSLSADIRLALSGNAEPYSSVLSAARFLRLVRGLPLSEIEVECDGKIYTVTVCADGKCYLVLRKFSVCTEEMLELFGCELKSWRVRTPFGSVRAVKVLDVSEFSDSALRALCLSDKGEDIIGAICFDTDGRKMHARGHFSKSGSYSQMLVGAISAVSCIHGLSAVPFSVDIFDVELFFAFRDGRLLISDTQPRPLTLYAPDIS